MHIALLDRALGLALGKDELSNDHEVQLRAGSAGDSFHKVRAQANTHRDQYELVGILLKYGGDPNAFHGLAYVKASRAADFRLLRMLCKSRPPRPNTLESILPEILGLGIFCIPALNILLDNREWYHDILNSSGTFSQLTTHPEKGEVISLLLQHGLRADSNGNGFFSVAIREQDLNLLKTLLTTQPESSTLKAVLQTAASSESDDFRLHSMKLALQQAGGTDIGQCDLLHYAVQRAVVGNVRDLKLLLSHTKRISDDINDSILQIATSAGNFEVVDLILSRQPALRCVHNACLTTSISTLGSHLKEKMISHLLMTHLGEYATCLPHLLERSMRLSPESDVLPIILAQKGVVPSYTTLQAAITRVSLKVFTILVKNLPGNEEATELIDFVQSEEMSAERRRAIYRCLLLKKLPEKVVTSTMISWLRDEDIVDLDTMKSFLENGANVGSDDGVAFSLAHDAGSANAFKLLCQHVTDDKTANIALTLALKAPFTYPILLQICRTLLSFAINPSVLDLVLVRSVSAFREEVPFIQSLIKKGANPSACFSLACKKGSEKQVRALARGVDLKVVVPALITAFAEESDVVRWLNVVLDEQPARSSAHIPGVLIQCLRKFPAGSVLLRLLSGLDSSVDAMTIERICPGAPDEQCTALLYALAPGSAVANAAIKVLLARGAKLGLSFQFEYPRSHAHDIDSAPFFSLTHDANDCCFVLHS
jgi:hypothetical protein